MDGWWCPEGVSDDREHRFVRGSFMFTPKTVARHPEVGSDDPTFAIDATAARSALGMIVLRPNSPEPVASR